jgi:hypothetical protein
LRNTAVAHAIGFNKLTTQEKFVSKVRSSVSGR